MDLSRATFERLVSAIGDISERCYCAGWMDGVEKACWKAIQADSDFVYGQDTILREELQFMKALSDRCNGWCEWRDPEGVVFVPIVEWRLRMAKES